MSQVFQSVPFAVVLLIIGFAFLVKGADAFVEGCSSIAKRFHVPSLIIGMTIVAMGTSAPEASVSINAALVGSNDIAISNVIGSNIFNILFILGMSAAITPLSVLPESLIDGVILLASGVLLYIFARTDRKMARKEGAACIGLYVLYTIYLLLR